MGEAKRRAAAVARGEEDWGRKGVGIPFRERERARRAERDAARRKLRVTHLDATKSLVGFVAPLVESGQGRVRR